MSRQGSRWEVTKRERVRSETYRKTVEERISSEKLVAGAIRVMRVSWRVEKSDIEFCKSRILRKKSLEVSAAGLMVRAGARAGPVYVL